ncbi:hypothetical protein EV175_004535 [Coemansia sp. RSA 1933]|nr:hypothetical protein EV175_004535 [Coemansia sp. RSA 1933]
MDLFFNRTEQAMDLYSMDRLNRYTVRLFPQVDRGFFLSDNDWTCYRRNYFQVSSTFAMVGANGPVSNPECPCLVVTNDTGSTRIVRRFLVGISAQVSGTTVDKKTVKLVQHTPKRDKGPQNTPEPQPIQATDSISQSALGISTNSICFERLQFKTATANNGKRRAAQQYYELMVELLADCDDGTRVVVAQSKSSPIVVRGRSPGHYADGAAVALGARPLSSSTSADARPLHMVQSLSASALNQYGSAGGGLGHHDQAGGSSSYSGLLSNSATDTSGRESPATAAAMAAAMAAASSAGYGFATSSDMGAFPGIPPSAAMAMAMAGGNNTQALVQARSASLDSFGLHGLIPTPGIGHHHPLHHHHSAQWAAVMPTSSSVAAAGGGGGTSSASSTPLTIALTYPIASDRPQQTHDNPNNHHQRYFAPPPPTFTSEAAATSSSSSDPLFQT